MTLEERAANFARLIVNNTGTGRAEQWAPLVERLLKDAAAASEYHITVDPEAMDNDENEIMAYIKHISRFPTTEETANKSIDNLTSAIKLLARTILATHA